MVPLSMPRKKEKRQRLPNERIAKEIRVELRSIIRQIASLRRPLEMFQMMQNRSSGSPKYRVVFDNRPLRKIQGLQICTKRITLPDEKIEDDVLNLTQSVWHLKDRFQQWAKIQSIRIDIEAVINQNKHLQVCSDLANKKKHGRTENRSGLSPYLSLVNLDTSKSGVIEIFYDGSFKEKELLVTNDVPIPYTVEILVNDETKSLGNAVDYICKAFHCWLPVIQEMAILNENDPESSELAKLLYG